MDLFGKTASELQADIRVIDSDGEHSPLNTGSIVGTLLEVTDYTGFSGDVEKQSGYFIALEFISDFSNDATYQVEIIGGESEGHPVTLDSDRTLVARIASTEQSIKVTATRGSKTSTKTYILSGITLN